MIFLSEISHMSPCNLNYFIFLSLLNGKIWENNLIILFNFLWLCFSQISNAIFEWIAVCKRMSMSIIFASILKVICKTMNEQGGYVLIEN